MVSFGATICWDVSQGLVISLLFALATVIIRTQCPQTARLGQITETELYRNPQSYTAAFENSFLTIFHFEAPLLFLNCEYFKDKAFKAQAQDGSRPFFIIDAASINSIDQMGLEAFIEISEEFKRREVTTLITGCNEAVSQMCLRCNVFSKIPRKHFFASLHDAVVFATSEANPTISVL